MATWRAAARRPAHQRQARSRRPKGPLRVQLSHPARQGRQRYALPDSVHPALQQRQVHFHSQATLPADDLRRADAEEHDLHRRRGRSFRVGLTGKDPGMQTFLMSAQRPASRWSSRSPAPARSRARTEWRKATTARAPAHRATSPEAASARPSTRPIRCQSTNGGFSAAWHYCWWRRGLPAAQAGGWNRSGCTSGRNDDGSALPRSLHPAASPAAKNAALLNALKEELFALESEKIAGTLPQAEYAEQKAALETVLKRALKKS